MIKLNAPTRPRPTSKRLYQPIWEQLKKNKSVTVTLPSKLHRRVIKAVIKEKFRDDNYKHWLDLFHAGNTAKLAYTIGDDSITFTLTFKYGTDRIF